MKVLDKMWFTTMSGAIGFVVAEDELTKERKAYIGGAPGFSEEEDTKMIMTLGCKVNIGMLKAVIASLEKQEDGT